MIRAENLIKHFGALKAVDGVSLNVKKGEILGFLGPNGAGKTTTMKMLTGFLVPTSGTVELCGFDLSKNLKQAQAKVGYLPEGAPLFSEMTPLSFLNFMANARGLRGKKKIDAIARVIEKIGLWEVTHQPIDTLSKGFRRRLGLAQAFLHDPEILILDEPTDGLDPNQKFEMRGLIRAMAKNKAIIISTHILEEVESLCTRAVIIANGKLVADGTPHELRARSRYHNAVLLVVSSTDRKKIRTALQELTDVASVETETEEDGKIVVLTALPKKGKAPLESIRALVKKRNFQVQELSVDPGRLEDVFRLLTTAKKDAA